jgi:hypothetical protein
MTQIAECGDARLSLGVYVLGAIDPADRAMVDEHLATCRDCRDELAGLAGLPALLSRVDKAEAIAFASDDIPADGADGEAALKEPAELIGTVLNLTEARRRKRNWRTIGLSAAAAVIVAAGAFGGAEAAASHVDSGSTQQATGLAQAPAPGQNPDYGSPISGWETAKGSTGGMVAFVMHETMGWGTQLAVRVVGVPVGTPCQLVAIGTDGSRTVVGGWTTDTAEGTIWYPASSQLPASQVREYQVTVKGHQPITVRA